MAKWVEMHYEEHDKLSIDAWQSARCSNCKRYHTTPYIYYFYKYPYCPYCGEKMNDDNDEGEE